MNTRNFTFSINILDQIVPLSEELKTFLSDRMRLDVFKKGVHLSEAGNICERLYVLKKGLVRGYFVSKKKEITTWVSCENELVTSISGFFQNQPCRENMQAIEETITESISFDDLVYCRVTFPEFATINRVLLEQYYIHAEERAFTARIPGAAERYDYFAKSGNKHLLQRVPHKYLASLLGVRPETLSRIITNS
ncbi:Crp/Fnr family transcriptional regulator [Belliella pelovolcani]|uniref:cAMP-binding domain of CRP or a regulatory subunit of cAMP-dependent protein kinases n=1 Tax=Belliella pelovolcani TaxID=529505 RepID=A0A1N7LK16_9BACT|nr:Crp/Fnr family transcriptional regulator [Belliella pelovolcani]SIS74188.1 cAMP-binding domain of CRP or a regulatory subunit of cAMP-dependent protein kinases [Belliella pelovolcani]